jgi:hypothetical protein
MNAKKRGGTQREQNILCVFLCVTWRTLRFKNFCSSLSAFRLSLFAAYTPNKNYDLFWNFFTRIGTAKPMNNQKAKQPTYARLANSEQRIAISFPSMP